MLFKPSDKGYNTQWNTVLSNRYVVLQKQFINGFKEKVRFLLQERNVALFLKEEKLKEHLFSGKFISFVSFFNVEVEQLQITVSASFLFQLHTYIENVPS